MPIRAARWTSTSKLSEAARQCGARPVLAAGVDEEALEVNAYGKSQSVAEDSDGYALERRVRLTLQAAARRRSRRRRPAKDRRAVAGTAPADGRGAEKRKPVISGRLGAARAEPLLFPPASRAYDSAWPTIPRSWCWTAMQTGESANPSPEKILAGIPRTRVSNQYTDATQQFFCGMWTSTAANGACAIPNTSCAC